MGGGDAPKPADPQKTAQAQTTSNINTAVASNALNNPNQYGPLGSIERTQTGTQNIGGVDVPVYDVTSSLDPTVQAIVDAQLQGAAGFGGADRGQYVDTIRALQQDEIDRKRLALENRLATQGITPGTEAYNEQIRLSNQTENDADLRAILAAGDYASQEIHQNLNNPIAQALALARGSQPNIPTQGQAIAPTDVAGIYNQAYQNELAAYNQEQAQQNALLGGLFGLGGTVLSAPLTGGASVGGALASGLFGL